MKRIIIDFNEVYESNNYGPFKIIEDLEGSPRRVRIKFLNTGYEREAKCCNAIRGKVRDYSVLRNQENTIQIDFNKVYESNNYGPFKIIEDLGGSPKRVSIKFLNTGFINEVQYEGAIKGGVRDCSLPYKRYNTVQIDFNEVYESKNYGPFKIIEDLGTIDGHRSVYIKFLNTGYENKVDYAVAIKGEVRDYSLNRRKQKNSIQIDFDKIYESNNYGPFKIIKDLGIINGSKKVCIKFINTGYENEVQYKDAINGDVRDSALPYNAKNSIQIDFNKIYESKNYGPFKIIEDLGGSPKRVRIRFINTGSENVVTYHNIITGIVRDCSLRRITKNIIINTNNIYESKNYGPFKIIEDLGGVPKRVRIKFLNTGFEKDALLHNVINGVVRDNSLSYITKKSIQIDFNKVYESNNYGPFKIIEDLGGGPKRVSIKFLNTGFINEVQYRNAINGNVRDNSINKK